VNSAPSGGCRVRCETRSAHRGVLIVTQPCAWRDSKRKPIVSLRAQIRGRISTTGRKRTEQGPPQMARRHEICGGTQLVFSVVRALCIP
jgi:hypothetical protein